MAGDPPLEQVVTRSVEAGVRGRSGRVTWHAGVFRAVNRDDILFVSSPQTGFGYFRNLGETLRRGMELHAEGRFGRVDGGCRLHVSRRDVRERGNRERLEQQHERRGARRPSRRRRHHRHRARRSPAAGAAPRVQGVRGRRPHVAPRRRRRSAGRRARPTPAATRTTRTSPTARTISVPALPAATSSSTPARASASPGGSTRLPR